LIEQAREFLKTDSLPEVSFYNNIGAAYSLHPRYLKTTGFIRGFLDKFFMTEMNSPLKLILIDGEFYKEQNRDDYNDAYNGVIWAYDRLRSLEGQLAPEGPLGVEIESITNEASGESQRARKLQGLIENIDVQMEEVASRLIEHISLLKNVLGGILHGDMGGRYDTLSNMGYIGRNENKNLQQKLAANNKKLDTFLEILARLYDSEKQVKE